MAEEYQQFLDFDWSDERWQRYLDGLYPPPNHKQILKFKKKWYKKTIDPEFDDTYEPPYVAPPTEGDSGGGGGSSSSSNVPPAAASGPWNGGLEGDSERWKVMGPKATICFVGYAVALTMSVAAVAGVFPPYQALVVLVGAFILEILAKYGLKFNSGYLHAVLLDDVGVMPMMALTLLTPGLHQVVRTLALVPPFLTALLSFTQICAAHSRLPDAVRDFFAPLAEMSARYQVMQGRADSEVLLGFVLIIAVFAVRAAPISALLFWNFMMMRYMMSPWTQASFKKIDGYVNPVLSNIPLIRNGYAALKRGLYSLVDPQTRQQRASNVCNIL